jgi:hypothetical protein
MGTSLGRRSIREIVRTPQITTLAGISHPLLLGDLLAWVKVTSVERIGTKRLDAEGTDPIART